MSEIVKGQAPAPGVTRPPRPSTPPPTPPPSKVQK